MFTIMKNSALQSLLDMAKKDGVKNNETTKQNIYQTKSRLRQSLSFFKSRRCVMPALASSPS